MTGKTPTNGPEVAQMRNTLSPTRSDWVAALVAAAVGLLTSPILAVWSLAAGVAVALVSLILLRQAPWARTTFFIGAGLAVGALLYFVAGVVQNLFSSGSGSGSGSG